MTRRRVVITGLGAICAIGKTAPDAWAAAKAGTSGARRVTRFDPSALASQNACEVKDWDSEALFGRDAKKIDLFTEFAIVAADEADSTLIINGPGGNWYCNDDFTGWDPMVELEDAPGGQYDIWVGTYSADEFINGTLYITEMDYDPDNLP